MSTCKTNTEKSIRSTSLPRRPNWKVFAVVLGMMAVALIIIVGRQNQEPTLNCDLPSEKPRLACIGHGLGESRPLPAQG